MSYSWQVRFVDANYTRIKKDTTERIEIADGVIMGIENGNRVTKKQWDRLGGLRNPHLYRKQSAGRWYYFATPEAVDWIKRNPE